MCTPLKPPPRSEIICLDRGALGEYPPVRAGSLAGGDVLDSVGGMRREQDCRLGIELGGEELHEAPAQKAGPRQICLAHSLPPDDVPPPGASAGRGAGQAEAGL